MDLRDYIAVLRRSWLLILGTTLLGAIAAGAYSLLSTPIYQSTAQLFIAISDGAGQANAGSAYTGALFAQQRVKSYTVIADTPAVLEPVIRELGLQTTPSGLAGQVSAVNPTGTVLVNVVVTDTDPQRAAATANAVAANFTKVIERLETPEGAQSSPVKPSLARPAVPSSTPISPKTKMNLLLGTLLGLMVGVGVAVLRHTMDTTVKSPDELAAYAGAAMLGYINIDASAKGSPLVATDKNSMRAEAFRTIRTNLQYVDVDNPPRSVVITSALHNEGKTTTACNLAITLAQSGSRVLLVEADLRIPKVADYFEIPGDLGLTNVLIGERTASSVVVGWNRNLLDIMPSGPIPPNPSELLGSQQMLKLLEAWYREYDVVLLDAPPLLPVTDAAVLASLADGAIIVARHGRTRREQVEQAAMALERVNARLFGAVLNFVPIRRSRKGYGYGYGYGQDEGSRPKLARHRGAAAKAPTTTLGESREVAAPPAKDPASKQTG